MFLILFESVLKGQKYRSKVFFDNDNTAIKIAQTSPKRRMVCLCHTVNGHYKKILECLTKIRKYAKKNNKQTK